MAIPVLKLNLAPPPSLWRRQHALLSWCILGLGILTLLAVSGWTWRAYYLAQKKGRETFDLSRQTQQSVARQNAIQTQLQAINVKKELPRWRLAERILMERSSPWSRLTAELERSLVQDMRIRSLQRTRGTDQKVVVKLKGEARTRAAEADFVDSVGKNPYFAQLVLERETERQGGGVDFEFTLPLSTTPPAYTPLPKFGPSPKSQLTKAAPPPIKAKAIAVPPPVVAKSPVPTPASPRPGITHPTEANPQATPSRPTRDPQPEDSEGRVPRHRPRSSLSRPNQEERR